MSTTMIKYSEFLGLMNGKIIIVKENEELSKFIEELHNSLGADGWPSDWIYERTYEAFEVLEGCESYGEFERAVASIAPEVYTHKLLEWAKALWAQDFIQEALEDLEKPRSLDHLLGYAQCVVIENVYNYVWEFINESNEDKE